MKKFAIVLIALTLSSCALLNKLTGNTEVAVPTPTEEIICHQIGITKMLTSHSEHPQTTVHDRTILLKPAKG